MKINPKINKRVNDSVEECHKVITEATVELLKSIGAECGEDVSLRNTLFLFQNKDNNTTKTIVFNMVAYEDRGSKPYLIVRHGDSYHASYFMSINNLLTIFYAVKAVVRSE